MHTKDFVPRLASSRSSEDPLLPSLADVLLSPHRGDEASAVIMRGFLVEALRVRLPGSSAFAEFKDDRDEARVTELKAHIVNHSSDEALFEFRLSDMHPIRAQDFREIHQEWVGAARWLGTIVTTQDRLGLLRRWAASPPDFTGAPPRIFGLLADLAGDLPSSPAAGDAARRFIQRALALGIEPSGYWAVRLLAYAESEALSDVEAALADFRGYPLVEATLHPDGADGAIAVLENWSPDSDREEMHRCLLLGEYYLRVLRIDDAIAISRSAYERLHSTAAALLAARALTHRHMIQGAVVHKRDLSDALILVIKARADRRRWGVDSGPALALEIRVRRLLSDYEGALDLVNGGGELPASDSELADGDVLAEAALMQAERGDLEIAKRLLGAVPPAAVAHISAVIADKEGRREDAARLWGESIEATDDIGDQADLALQLAMHGIHAPDVVSKLRSNNPDIARELDQIAALFGHEAGALEEFRGFANSSYRGALFYYVFLRDEGDSSGAAEWARGSGKRWSDPDLLLESASYRLLDGSFSEAIEDVGAALLTASDEWGGRRRAFRILVESHSNNGDWNGALAAAANLVTMEPDNASAVWALVVCQLRLNDHHGALRSWQQYGSPAPRGETEVRGWIDLLGEFGEVVGSSQDALDLSTKFAGNEEIRSALIAVFFTKQKSAGVTDDESTEPLGSDDDHDEGVDDPEKLAFQEMLASYLRDFPDGAIRQVPINMADPLSSLRELFRSTGSSSELEAQLDRGSVPIGLAGEVYGRTYLEVLLTREYGPVFAGSTDIAAEDDAISSADRDGAIADLSALASLSRLPEGLRETLSGHFPNVRALSEQQRDAVIGRRSISNDSGLTYRPARNGSPESVSQLSAEQLEARAALAEVIAASFTRFAVITQPQVRTLPLGDARSSSAFLSSADTSLTLSLPFWADDFALKEIVRQAGGTPFGTPALLNRLRAEGDVDSSLIDLAEATLVSKGYIGIRHRQQVWDLAQSLSIKPDGLIHALRYSGGDDAEGRLNSAFRLIDASVDEPDVFEAFVHATAQWLENIAPSEEAASQNMTLLARRLLGQVWLSSSTLPYCVSAFRAVEGRANASEVLLREIYRTFEAIADEANDQQAAVVVFELVSRLDPHEGMRLRSAILRRRFE